MCVDLQALAGRSDEVSVASKTEGVEWWMPPSMRRLFKWEVCLQNQQFVFHSSFSELMDILIKPTGSLSVGVCMCVRKLHVSNYRVLARRRDFICFHVSCLISKTDEITNTSYSHWFSPLILYALMSHCLAEWAFEILPISLYFHSLPLLLAAHGKTHNTHTHTHNTCKLAHMLTWTHSHKWALSLLHF